VSGADRPFRTQVGTGTNKRVEDLKGPFVKTIEGIAHDLADSMVSHVEAMREANGPIPAFQSPLSPERLAALHLPEWFVRGNTDPRSDVATKYWTDRVSRPNEASPRAAGPAGARMFQQQMARMWQNPRYRAIAYESMPPELRDELLQHIRAGIHPGHARTLVNGKIERVPEDGDITEHLGKGAVGG
jgi:hypothetical protein